MILDVEFKVEVSFDVVFPLVVVTFKVLLVVFEDIVVLMAVEFSVLFYVVFRADVSLVVVVTFVTLVPL